MFAQLGDVVFELLKAPAELEQQKTYEWAEHAIFRRKDRLQYVGLRADTVTLVIRFHSLFCDPDREFAALQKLADSLKPVPLVLGTGEILGDFVVVSLRKTVERTFQDGRSLSIVVELVLREYVR